MLSFLVATEARAYLVTMIVAAAIGTVVLAETNYSKSHTQQKQKVATIDNTATVTYSNDLGSLFKSTTNQVSVSLPANSAPAPAAPPSPELSSPKTPERISELQIPHNLRARLGASKNSVRLEWDPGSALTTGFRIYRNTVSVGTTNATQSSFTDTVILPGHYRYEVRSFNANNHYSDPSAALSIVADLTITVLPLDISSL